MHNIDYGYTLTTVNIECELSHLCVHTPHWCRQQTVNCQRVVLIHNFNADYRLSTVTLICVHHIHTDFRLSIGNCIHNIDADYKLSTITLMCVCTLTLTTDCQLSHCYVYKQHWLWLYCVYYHIDVCIHNNEYEYKLSTVTLIRVYTIYYGYRLLTVTLLCAYSTLTLSTDCQLQHWCAHMPHWHWRQTVSCQVVTLQSLHTPFTMVINCQLSH